MKNILKVVNIPNGINLVIQRPSINDATKIIEFLNEVGGETDFLTFGLNEFPISISEEKATINECLEKNSCLMLIATIDNKIIAQLFLQRSNKTRLAHIGDIAISVSKKYWGLSIGKQMMLTAIEWAEKNNISKIQLQVRSDNNRAIQLYNNLGFIIEGKITRALKINNEYFDDYIMGLEL